MEEKNELNNLILEKNNSSKASNNKKIILAVATLGVILIIVVMLMNTLTSNGTDNLPQAVLPPEPKVATNSAIVDKEPLFEDVEVLKENDDNNLDKITQKLKQESKQEVEETKNRYVKPTPTKVIKKKEPVYTKKTNKNSIKTKQYFVQVGSFSKYKPNKKFLESITNIGFSYQYKKVTVKSRIINKVLVGPFANEKSARNALKRIRAKVESGAFLTKL